MSILCLVAALHACREQKQDTGAATGPAAATAPDILQLTPAQRQATGYTTTSLELRTLEKTLQLSGKITVLPTHLTALSSPLGGHVKSIGVVPGSSFRKGQVLAVLEDNQFIQLQQDYLIAKARVEAARHDYERQKTLNLSKAASDKAYQAAEAEFRTLTATKHALEARLRLLHIDPAALAPDKISSVISLYAPFHGSVSQVLVTTGQYVTPSEALFELIDPNGRVAQVKIFENDLSGAKTGQEIMIYTNPHPEKKIRARVISVVKKIREDGSADLLARLTEPAPELVAGSYIQGVLKLENVKRESLPEESVVSYENADYVFEDLGQSRFRLIGVQTGASRQGYLEITNSEALKNKKIVQKGAYDLLMALKNQAEE